MNELNQQEAISSQVALLQNSQIDCEQSEQIMIRFLLLVCFFILSSCQTITLTKFLTPTSGFFANFYSNNTHLLVSLNLTGIPLSNAWMGIGFGSDMRRAQIYTVTSDSLHHRDPSNFGYTVPAISSDQQAALTSLISTPTSLSVTFTLPLGLVNVKAQELIWAYCTESLLNSKSERFSYHGENKLPAVQTHGQFVLGLSDKLALERVIKPDWQLLRAHGWSKN